MLKSRWNPYHCDELQFFIQRETVRRNLLLEVAQMSTAKRALLGTSLGRQGLQAGITTVRDLGNSGGDGGVAQ